MADSPDNTPTIPPHLRDNPLTNLGLPRQRQRKLEKQEADMIVEYARTLLVMDVNRCDMKREIGRKFKLDPRSAERYITLAGRRNQTCLGESADESLAKSLGYWSRKKQQAEQRLQREQGIEQRANTSLEKCDSDFDKLREQATKDNPLIEQFEIIEMRRANAINLREQARKAMFTAEMVSKEAQREIDRLKGNHAPVKIAKTDSKGQDIAKIPAAERQDRMRALGMKPVLTLKPVESIDVTPPRRIEQAATPVVVPVAPLALPPVVPVNGHHKNGHSVNGQSQNGHIQNGHSNGKPQNGQPQNGQSANGNPTTGGDDDLQ